MRSMKPARNPPPPFRLSLNRSTPSPHPSPPLGAGERVPEGRVRGRPAEMRQILLALDHCVLGAVEHDQLVAHVAQASGQPPEALLVVFSHTHGACLMGLERASLPGG